MLTTFAALLCGTAFAVAQTKPANDVVVRTTVKPESGIVLGQHVRVLVDVLFADGMKRPPRVALPDMPGAQIVRYETQATTMTDRIDDRDYVGQRFEFALYPRRGGALEIPAAQVTLLDAKGDATGRAVGRPARIDVTAPAGVDPSQPVVATTRLALEEQWTPAPSTSFRAGDALVRTVTRTAADVPGMAMLDLLFTAPPGVRLYREPPETDDRQERGDLTGRRIDKVTYVFEQGGSFPLPAVSQPWWDLEAGRLRRAEGQGVTVAVAAVAVLLPAGERAERWLFAGVIAIGVLALVSWAWPRLRAWRGDRQARWLASEPKAFADLQAACRQDDARAVYRAFTLWRRRTERAPALASFAEEIESAVFAGAPWSSARARDFCARLAAWRLPSRPAARPSALPSLNPS